MFLGLTKLRLGLGLAALVLIGLAAWTLSAMVDKIDRQGQRIAELRGELDAEKAARQADVAGLTVLSQGILAASSARALDETVLRETIDARNPQPVSGQLGAFLDRLRSEGSPAPAHPAAARAGAPAGAGASAPRR